MKCLNCETEFDGLYCPQCSQKSITSRLTVFSVIKDFLDAISDSDKGFLKTVIDLSQNPGLTVNNYISGKRARYLSAGKYTFFITVLFTINVTYLEHHFGMFETMVKGLDVAEVKLKDTKSFEITTGTHQETDFKAQKVKQKPSKTTITLDTDSGVFSKVESSKEKSQKEEALGEGQFRVNFDFLGVKVDKTVTKARFLRFLKDLIPHYHRTLFDILKFLIVLWIPVFSFFSYIFFFRAPYNFAEHITFNSFVFSHILLIFMLISPAYWFAPQLNSVTFMSASASALFYLFFAYLQFFKMRSYRLVKAAFSLSIGGMTYIIILSSLMTFLAFYIAYQNIHLL